MADENGVLTSWTYDGFGRSRSMAPQGDMKTTTTYAPHWGEDGYVGIEEHSSSEDGAQRIDVSDDLGRNTLSRIDAFDGTAAVHQTIYAITGQIARSSRPGAGAPGRPKSDSRTTRSAG